MKIGIVGAGNMGRWHASLIKNRSDIEFVGITDIDQSRCSKFRIRNTNFGTDRKNKAIQWLRDKVFANRKQCELNSRHLPLGMVKQFVVQSSLWWTQEGLFNHAYTFYDHRFAGNELESGNVDQWRDLSYLNNEGRFF